MPSVLRSRWINQNPIEKAFEELGSSSRIFVLHHVNVPAGGATERIELSDFLFPGNADDARAAFRILAGNYRPALFGFAYFSRRCSHHIQV